MAQALDGLVQIASGAFPGHPGDLVVGNLLGELKERAIVDVKGAKWVRFEKAWLDRIFEQATKMGKLPFLLYRYSGDERVYAVLPLETLIELLHRERAGECYGELP